MADMDKNAIAQALRELDWKSLPVRNREAIEQAIEALGGGEQKQPVADEAVAQNDGRAALELAGATAALRECLAAEEAWSWMAQFEGDEAVDEVERARAAIRRAAARESARKLLAAAPVPPSTLKAGDHVRGGTFAGTHGEIEDALDKAGAPMQDGARWLTFPERIATLVAPVAAVPLTLAQRDSIWVAAEVLEKSDEHAHAAELRAMLKAAPASTVAADALAPIPMLLFCPACGLQHIDAPEAAREGVKAWDNPPHRSHKCRACEAVWRPADVPTVGVASIQTSGQADNWDSSAHTVAAGAVRTVTIDEVEKSFLCKLLSFAWEVDIMWHRDRNEIRRIKLDVRDGVSMAPGLVERRVDLIREFVTTGRNAFSRDGGADGELVTADQTAEAAQ
jgi:hypothetical protein